MMRVVLDTNILVSSLFWDKGNPHRVVALALDKKIWVFTSPEILQELEKVLKRDFEEPEEIIQRQINLVLEYATVVKPLMHVQVVERDPKDDMVIECAVACKAHSLVTGDKHLLDVQEYRGIKIVNAKTFLDRFT